MLTLKDKIVKLRASGFKYREIAKRVKCSMSTVTLYATKNGIKNKKDVSDRYRKSLHPYIEKIIKFCSQKLKRGRFHQGQIKESDNKLLRRKVRDFNKIKGEKVTMLNFTLEEVLEKLGESPKCYLTGETIDINKPRTYQFDHVIPRSKGGTNTLDNLGICTKEANLSKCGMTKEEYLEHCKKVLLHHGYKVEK